MKFEEIIYEKSDKVAWITANRPKKLNTCTPLAVHGRWGDGFLEKSPMAKKIKYVFLAEMDGLAGITQLGSPSPYYRTYESVEDKGFFREKETEFLEILFGR